MNSDLLGAERGAIFSPDRVFRYRWWDIWDPSARLMNLCMLNPSTADEWKSDPTITRGKERANELKCGGLIVTNAYAFKATDPKELRRAAYPIGPENDEHIVACATLAGLVICGWGKEIRKERERDVLRLIRWKAKKTPHAIIFTKGGRPGHPLYVPYEGCPPMEITDPNFCMGCGFEIAPSMGTGLCGECACEDDSSCW